jgi:hypothetical protein
VLVSVQQSAMLSKMLWALMSELQSVQTSERMWVVMSEPPAERVA